MPTYRISIPIKVRITSTMIIGTTLFILGVLALTIATIYSATVPAFIGLGLIFWGTILLYIQTEEYTKNIVLTATATALQTSLDQTLSPLGFRGKAVYLPSKYLNSLESNKAYIPRDETGKLPTPEQTRKLENQRATGTNQGILITPPGAELARLFEDRLGTTFIEIDLNYLEQHLPRLLIEDLEIAQSVEIQIQTTQHSRALKTGTEKGLPPIQQRLNTIHMKIASSTYITIAQQAQQLSSLNSFGCPLTSAIALAIAKASGKPTVIQSQMIDQNEKTIETTYQTLLE
jgi:hypothetical protein